LSTILKALKRIDQTTPPDDLQDWPPRIDTQNTVKARVRRLWLYRKVFLALILTVVVVAAGWLAYTQRHWLVSKISPQKKSTKSRIYQSKIIPESDDSKDAAPEKAPAMKGQNDRSGTRTAPRPAAVKRSSRRVPPVPASQKNQKTSSGKARAPGANTASKSNISRSPVAGSGKSRKRDTRSAAAAPVKKSASRAPRSYRRLDDPAIKLQAIAWSKDAAQRLAVINGHIVREGESVEGFLINQIRQEDVVVNDGSTSWQLEFSLK
jgi:type IV secretory pathway VirB10-like protein